MKKTAVANLKGGVGKSSTTLFLAEHWAVFKDLKVLVIDLDPQANASYMLLSRAGVQQAENAGRTLLHLFEDTLNGNIQNAMAYIVPRASDLIEINRHNAQGYVSIVPSIPRLWFQQYDFDRDLYAKGQNPVATLAALLRGFLEAVAQNYHCVLFDCPPGFGTLSRVALQLADHIVAPTIADYTSMRSLQDFVTLGLKGTLELDVDRKLHVVVSKFTGTNSQKKALDLLRQTYGKKLKEPVIPMRDQVQVAAERHSTQTRTYAQKYERPRWNPLKPHVKGMSDKLYGVMFPPPA